MLLISCPCFTVIKEGGKNDSSVYLDFGCLRDASLIPYIPVELAKGWTRFCESGVHLVLHDDRLRAGAAEVGELFRHFLSLSLDGDVGLDVWFSIFFVLMVWPKLSQAIENLSTLFWMLALVVAFSAQSSANRNSLTISIFTLVFAWSLLRLKTELLVQYWMLIPLSEPLNASNSITENVILKRVGARTHPYLTPNCDGKGYGAFFIVLHPCMNAVMKLSKNGDEFFRAAIFCNDSPKHHFCWPCQMPWSDQHKSSRGQCSVPDTSFETVLQQTPCQQSHVPNGSCIDSSVSVYVQDGCWGDSEVFWQGSCPKLKVRRFHSDYCMLVNSLSVCKYGWRRHPWSPVVVLLSPIMAEWGSEVYSSVLIHPPYRFLQEFSQIWVLCHWIVNGQLSELPPELEWHWVTHSLDLWKSFNGLV